MGFFKRIGMSPSSVLRYFDLCDLLELNFGDSLNWEIVQGQAAIALTLIESVNEEYVRSTASIFEKMREFLVFFMRGMKSFEKGIMIAKQKSLMLQSLKEKIVFLARSPTCWADMLDVYFENDLTLWQSVYPKKLKYFAENLLIMIMLRCFAYQSWMEQFSRMAFLRFILDLILQFLAEVPFCFQEYESYAEFEVQRVIEVTRSQLKDFHFLEK